MARSSGEATSSTARAPSAISSLACGPTICTPTTRSVPRSTTTRVRPSRSAIVAARPEADSGTVPTTTSSPAARASASVAPTVAISGSENTTSGTSSGSRSGARPESASTAIAASAVARWASAGPATTSPIAAATGVARRSSATVMWPVGPTGMPARSSPSSSELGRRPTATRTMPAGTRSPPESRNASPRAPPRSYRCARRRRAPRGGGDRPHEHRVEVGEDPLLRLDERHARPELGQRGAELDADVARADHRDRLRQRLERERLRRAEHALAVERKRASGVAREPVASSTCANSR